MIKAGILGSTGYAGAVLTGLLSNHNDVEISYLSSHSYIGKKFSDIYPGMKGKCDLELRADDINEAVKECDVIFLALPAGIASKCVTSSVLEKCKIIDLGADFRLKSKETYEVWYKCQNYGGELLERAVYGLCEIHKEEIKKAQLIANPGCYTTCSILSLYPLVKNELIDTTSIIIDAKSGVTGAGRSEKLTSLYSEVDESIKPYGIANHRHTPEIEQELGLASGEAIKLQFTPHLVPMQRGILATSYARLKPNVSQEMVASAYAMYKNEMFIRVIDTPPETRYVKGSNLCDIYYKLDTRTGNIIVAGALDNLIKGAAGQAVQNMNIAFSLPEGEGLQSYSICPQ